MLVYVNVIVEDTEMIAALNPFSVSSVQESLEPSEYKTVIIMNNGYSYISNESVIELVGKINAEYKY